MTTTIWDGDGHAMEDVAGIKQRLLPVHQRMAASGVFPQFDHLKIPPGLLPEGTFRWDVGAPEWIDFLDRVGIETTVLYPTLGLAYGRITNEDWAIDVARAYNSWLYESHLSKSPRLQGVGLIPMQDPDAAIEELRRIVKDLGMRGAFLPSTGLKAQLGSKEYWPVYAEAERLGCSLAVHGGAHSGMGFDDINFNAPAHALGHPFGILISFAGMLFNGVFDRFPNLRVGFLEAGVGWLIMALERFSGSQEAVPSPDPRGRYLQLQPGEKISGYVIRKMRAGQIFVGCEGDEPSLGYAVDMVGSEPYIYSSDFPHEVTPESCRHEIDEILEREDLSAASKEAILHGNARRFYQRTAR